MEEQLTSTNINTHDENDINRQDTTNSAQIKPNYDYLLDVKERSFYFETNKPIKYIFWILLVFSIVALIVLYFLLKNIYIIIIFAAVFIIILFILSILRYGIKIELNIEKEQVDLKRKSIIPIFTCLNKHYNLVEIKTFELDCETINPEYSEFRLNLILLKDDMEINIFHRWGLTKEKEKFENITTNLNAFISSGVQEAKSNRVTRTSINDKDLDYD